MKQPSTTNRTNENKFSSSAKAKTKLNRLEKSQTQKAYSSGIAEKNHSHNFNKKKAQSKLNFVADVIATEFHHIMIILIDKIILHIFGVKVSPKSLIMSRFNLHYP
jgi:hypothetical protein